MLRYLSSRAVITIIGVASWFVVETARTSDALTSLDAYLSSLVANRQFSGAILVAVRGKVVFQRAVGYANIADRRLNTPQTPFPIASVSKLLTATAILQLVENGQLQLEDPAALYLSGFPYPNLTIRQLLSHTSGLPPYNAYFDSLRAVAPERVFTNDDFLPQVRACPVPLRYVPGSNGNYDNINFLVLAEIVRAVTGRTYVTYVRERVLRPAGMRQTTYRAAPLERNQGAPSAVPYIFLHQYSTTPVAATAIPYAVNYWHAYQFVGFSGFESTLGDLLRFDRALHTDGLLSQATLHEAYIPVRLADGRVNPGRFGFGWAVETDSSMGTVVYHSGSATGLSCVLLRNITADQTVIVFQNTGEGAHEVALNALRLLNGRPIDWPRRSLAKVFGAVLVRQGPDVAADTLQRLRADTANYYLSEGEFNALGYDFLGKNAARIYHLPVDLRVWDAVAVFRVNAEQFPLSWNVWDSYGEALFAAGLRDSAVTMYRRSVELNPQNKNGASMLDSLSRRP